MLWKRTPARRHRRGVLLLVVLSLLVVFILISITFVMTASQQKDAARAAGRMAQTATDPVQLLDGSLHQLVRDTTNPRSVLRGHSLLRDMYGDDFVPGTVTAATLLPGTGGQLIDIQITAISGPPGRPLSQLSGYYNGCVLTVIDGDAAGTSARIVRYDVLGSTYRIRLMRLDREGAPVSVPAVGSRVLINGRPFNGTGFGFNPATGKLDATLPGGDEIALLPNHFGIDYLAGGFDGYLLGGADESYDAADYQNVALAYVPLNPSDDTLAPQNLDRVVLPSFHRRALINYWRNQVPNLATDGNRLRRISLRPNWIDHPLFTGSNPAYAAMPDPVLAQRNLDVLINGPWDVDNDGDMVRDSVWIDLGYPVSRAPDGRLYKPLFAVLCADLDGKFNLNAHGSREQLPSAAPPSPPVTLAGGVSTADPNFPRGQGYGPAEIQLSLLFGNSNEFEALLNGSAALGIAGRYGADAPLTTLPGFAGGPVPGRPGWDRLAQVKFFEHPQAYATDTPPYVVMPRTAFGSPPDLPGRFALGLDERGVPLYDGLVEGPQLDDSPYEIDLSRNGPRGTLVSLPASMPADTPYTVHELEKLLRAFDSDAGSLPDRLWRLTGTFINGADARENRRSVTTDSYDLPVPSVVAPHDLRQDPSIGGSIPAQAQLLDLVAARLQSGGVPATDLDRQIAALLAPELLMGQRMDINRPFGNARDETGEGTVDEPFESSVRQPLYQPLYANVDFLGIDANGDGTVDARDRFLARHLYARHLFTLAMLLTNARGNDSDSGYLHPVHPADSAGGNANQRRELTARRLAQWAVNVVDFRDADSIMTPFEYDVNPFNGWDVDGWIGSDTGPDGRYGTGDEAVSADDGHAERRWVFGCEHPDLLLTETLAFHDTRLKDSGFDPSGTKRDEDGDGMHDPASDDDDLDQYRVPQGSFFAELYCTSNGNNPVLPPELFQFNPATSRWELDLGRLAPPTPAGQRYPVWRLAISRSHIAEAASLRGIVTANPESTTLEMHRSADPPRMHYFDPSVGIEIERIVWFTSQTPGPGTVDSDRIFWNRAGTSVLVPPGQYAVVGPRRRTYIGSRNNDTPSNHLIDLSRPPGGNTVHVVDNGAGPAYPTIGANIQKAVGIVAAMDPPGTWASPAATAPEGIGVNVSEPLPTAVQYYPEPTVQLTGYPTQDAYGEEAASQGQYLDQPLDHLNGTPLEDDNLLGEGTKPNYRSVALQRLANPLAPWNPLPSEFGHDPSAEVNPYLTVDWMPVDLTVFNGEDLPPANWAGPGDWNSPQTISGPLLFSTRERGLRNAGTGNLWRTVTEEPMATNPGGSPNNYFQHNLNHTLGYLNSTYGIPRTAPAQYIGDPPQPFPWLTWNNRPYVSQLELMLVPASSPSRLLLEFSMAPNAEGQPDDNRYDPHEGSAPGDSSPYDNLHTPFGHVLNFFQSSVNPQRAAHFYRLLEYTHVPSRFIGTDTVLNPDASAFGGAGLGTEGLRPPFHRISHYRDPGRINLNTISDPRVWQAIQGDLSQFALSNAGDVTDSRRGYPSGPPPAPRVFSLNGNVPTFFANPFRSPDSGQLVPLRSLERAGVECTLLRSADPGDAGAPTPPPPSDPAWLVSQFTTEFNHSDRNAYFHYQRLLQLGNLVTTRSNVYAVWVTVGFFEVEPIVPSAVHPDGYQLSREMGSDSGEIKRHRAFYIIDRTIPVAFEPGVNHNVDRAVLLRRFIE